MAFPDEQASNQPKIEMQSDHEEGSKMSQNQVNKQDRRYIMKRQQQTRDKKAGKGANQDAVQQAQNTGELIGSRRATHCPCKTISHTATILSTPLIKGNEGVGTALL